MSTCSNFRDVHLLWISHRPCRVFKLSGDNSHAQPRNRINSQQVVLMSPAHSQSHPHHSSALSHAQLSSLLRAGRKDGHWGRWQQHVPSGRYRKIPPFSARALSMCGGVVGFKKICWDLWALQGTDLHICHRLLFFKWLFCHFAPTEPMPRTQTKNTIRIKFSVMKVPCSLVLVVLSFASTSCVLSVPLIIISDERDSPLLILPC